MTVKTGKARTLRAERRIVLLDLDTPEITGVELIEQIQKAASLGRATVKTKAWTVVDGLPGGFDPLRLGLVWSNLVDGEVLSSVEALRATIKEGISKSAFERLADMIDISQEELAMVIGVKMRTLARRQHLVRDEAERLLRVANAFQETIEAMKELDASREWFKSPQRALGEHTPLEYCDTEMGAQEVTDLLGRIRHGVFS
jgi:putative toxin-antitoxin system antitoxin component (TIGR02293 family)